MSPLEKDVILLQFVAGVHGWADVTASNNLSTLRRIYKTGEMQRQIHNTSEAKLIRVSRAFTNPNSRTAVLQLMVALRRSQDKSVKLLTASRHRIQLTEIASHKKHQNAVESERIIPFDGLEEMIASAEASRPETACILILVAELGCRVRDLYCTITTSKEEAEAGTDNVILIRTKDVRVIRRKFKTQSTYGVLDHIIAGQRGTQLRRLLRKLKRENGAPLVTQARGGATPPQQMAMRVRKLTGGYGAHLLFKSWLSHHREMGDFKRFSNYAHTRGTALGTLVEWYDLSNKDQPAEDSLPTV